MSTTYHTKYYRLRNNLILLYFRDIVVIIYIFFFCQAVRENNNFYALKDNTRHNKGFFKPIIFYIQIIFIDDLIMTIRM